MLKNAVRVGLRYFGYDLQRVVTPRLIDFLMSRRINVLVDVGANTGQFATQVRHAGYRGKILSFEPGKAAFDQLRCMAANDREWETYHCALGASKGEMTLNVSEDSRFSSFRPLLSDALQFDPHAAVNRQETVNVQLLDDFIEPYLDENLFVKIDTQGFEQSVLKGASKTLGVALGVQMELPLVHFYANTWSIAEAIEWMSDTGFAVAQIRPVNFHTADPVSLVEVDCVFRRKSERDFCLQTSLSAKRTGIMRNRANRPAPATCLGAQGSG